MTTGLGYSTVVCNHDASSFRLNIKSDRNLDETPLDHPYYGVKTRVECIKTLYKIKLNATIISYTCMYKANKK